VAVLPPASSRPPPPMDHILHGVQRTVRGPTGFRPAAGSFPFFFSLRAPCISAEAVGLARDASAAAEDKAGSAKPPHHRAFSTSTPPPIPMETARTTQTAPDGPKEGCVCGGAFGTIRHKQEPPPRKTVSSLWPAQSWGTTAVFRPRALEGPHGFHTSFDFRAGLGFLGQRPSPDHGGLSEKSIGSGGQARVFWRPRGASAAQAPNLPFPTLSARLSSVFGTKPSAQATGPAPRMDGGSFPQGRGPMAKRPGPGRRLICPEKKSRRPHHLPAARPPGHRPPGPGWARLACLRPEPPSNFLSYPRGKERSPTGGRGPRGALGPRRHCAVA